MRAVSPADTRVQVRRGQRPRTRVRPNPSYRLEPRWRKRNRARFYQSAIGRFLQEDPVGKFDESRFLYALNKPLVFTDPRGLFTVSDRRRWIPTSALDAVCTRKDNAGECVNNAIAWITCDCDCDNGLFRPRATLYEAGDVYIYAGNFKNLKRRPTTDKSVVDFESAKRHVDRVHYRPAIEEVRPMIAALEAAAFGSEEACRDTCSLVGLEVSTTFAIRIGITQRDEDKGWIPR